MPPKSAAQLRRLQSRATVRGETYISPALPAPTSTSDPTPLQSESYTLEQLTAMTAPDRRTAKRKMNALGLDILPPIDEPKVKPAPFSAAANSEVKPEHAEEELSKMTSKERRIAKRKAESITASATGANLVDMRKDIKLNEIEERKKVKLDNEVVKVDSSGDDKESEKKKGPFIAFIGQMSYTTTLATLQTHIQSHLPPAIYKTLKIRMLTHEKSGRSKGMGFIETTTPEGLFELCKLHHITVEGRRINIERTTGGGKSSEKRKEFVKKHRDDTKAFVDETVDKIIAEYVTSGDLKDDELDEGVIGLCKRHAPNLVSQAIKEYIEMRGTGLSNPSAYLSSIITRISIVGVEKSESERVKLRKLEEEGKGGRRGGVDGGRMAGVGKNPGAAGRGGGGGGRGDGGSGRGGGGVRGDLDRDTVRSGYNAGRGGRGGGSGGGRGGGAASAGRTSGLDMKAFEGL